MCVHELRVCNINKLSNWGAACPSNVPSLPSGSAPTLCLAANTLETHWTTLPKHIPRRPDLPYYEEQHMLTVA